MKNLIPDSVRQLFLSLLTFVTVSLSAQSDFRPGYIIDHQGDTIKGEIDFKFENQLSRYCKFRDSGQIIHKYLPDEIEAFRFEKGKYYVSMNYKGKQYFFEYLIKGIVDIYYIRDQDGDHYYIDKENEPLCEIPFDTEVRNINGTNILFESQRHKGLLDYYMHDVPAVEKRIEHIQKPRHNELIALARDYHNAVCEDGSQCIVYEQKSPAIKLIPEVITGFAAYNPLYGFNKDLYFQKGVLAHISMPRSSEKMFLTTGLIHTRVLYSYYHYASGVPDYNSLDLYKIPVYAEYIYPKGLFRPRFSYGVNLSVPFVYPTTTFRLGANWHISKKLNISTTGELETITAFFIVPVAWYAYGFHLGFYLDL